MLTRHEPESRARSITVEQSIAPGAEVLEADPFRIEQALDNLVANALRYTPERGRIRLEAAQKGDRLALCVADSGPGISAEHLPFIFDRF